MAGRPAHQLRGHIQLDQVSFRYGPMSPLVLKNVSLEIGPGELVAVVVPPGPASRPSPPCWPACNCPSEGRLLFDGVDFAEMDLLSLRRQLGVVNQSTHLFAGSIRDNIALSDPRAPVADIIHAAKLAKIHEDIVPMPLGYDTRLAERGGSLSGGQRQRVAWPAPCSRPADSGAGRGDRALDAVNEAEYTARWTA